MNGNSHRKTGILAVTTTHIHLTRPSGDPYLARIGVRSIRSGPGKHVVRFKRTR